MRFIFRSLVTKSSRRCVILQSKGLQKVFSYKDRNNFSLNYATCRRFVQSSAREIVFKSPRPDIEIPVVSLSDFMFSRFAKYGNKRAIVSV